MLVRVRVGSWVIYYVSRSPHKGGSASLCVCAWVCESKLDLDKLDKDKF